MMSWLKPLKLLWVMRGAQDINTQSEECVLPVRQVVCADDVLWNPSKHCSPRRHHHCCDPTRACDAAAASTSASGLERAHSGACWRRKKSNMHFNSNSYLAEFNILQSLQKSDFDMFACLDNLFIFMNMLLGRLCVYEFIHLFSDLQIYLFVFTHLIYSFAEQC